MDRSLRHNKLTATRKSEQITYSANSPSGTILRQYWRDGREIIQRSLNDFNTNSSLIAYVEKTLIALEM